MLAFPKLQTFLGKPRLDQAIAADFSFCGMWSEGVLLNFDDNQPLSYYEDNNLIVYRHPWLSISIRSNSNKSWIRLAPFLIIEILRRDRFEEARLYIDTQDGKGGGGNPRYMQSVFLGDSPNRFKASYAGEGFTSYSYFTNGTVLPKTEDIYHSFTLQPGEIEVFDLDFTVEPGYIFDFRVGISYIFEERQKITWSTIYKIGTPTEAELWTIKGEIKHSGDYKWVEYPENYKDVGLMRLHTREYAIPEFDQNKAVNLFNFSQSLKTREFPV